MYCSEMDLFNRNLPPVLRNYRQKRNLTQLKLAIASDIDYKHVQVLESNRIAKDPHMSTLNKIARGLGIPTSQLIALCFGEMDEATTHNNSRKR